MDIGGGQRGKRPDREAYYSLAINAELKTPIYIITPYTSHGLMFN
jgi:hypothetical protein